MTCRYLDIMLLLSEVMYMSCCFFS